MISSLMFCFIGGRINVSIIIVSYSKNLCCGVMCV